MTGKSKALPREKGLKENALRRMNEAHLKEIENHLRKIRKTTDLSYSNVKNQGTEDTKEAEADKKLIDPETLMRLIDECKEEEDRLQVINSEEIEEVQQ